MSDDVAAEAIDAYIKLFPFSEEITVEDELDEDGVDPTEGHPEVGRNRFRLALQQLSGPPEEKAPSTVTDTVSNSDFAGIDANATKSGSISRIQ